MSIIERVKPWLRTLWTALAAAEEGPYGHMDRRLASLNDRVRQLEEERPSGGGARAADCAARGAPDNAY